MLGLLGIFAPIDKQKQYAAFMKNEAIRHNQAVLESAQQRQREYLNSLPRFKGKSIVPIVPLEKQKPAAN